MVSRVAFCLATKQAPDGASEFPSEVAWVPRYSYWSIEGKNKSKSPVRRVLRYHPKYTSTDRIFALINPVLTGTCFTILASAPALEPAQI
eukprot:scaffold119564_cov14-Prasinocladus_malaysianus.AAC.1